ncbi:MAG: hypothetical protein WAL32_09355 [Terriglobales bacterium]
MKPLMKLSFLAILAVTLSAPMLAQGVTAHAREINFVPGQSINWTIKLNPLVAGGPSGTAQYMLYVPVAAGAIEARLSVECENVTYPTATVLDVFLQPPTGPTPSQNKYIGRMEVQNGSAALLLLTANAPTITKGTKIIVAIHDGPVQMVGVF